MTERPLKQFVQLYNTLSREKERFSTLESNHVRMYVCGPTVYNYIHIGNARVFVFFDVVRRFLQHIGYQVTYVQNFTDVDDRLIDASNQTGKSVSSIAEKYIEAYFADMDALGVVRADVHPRATQHIDAMIQAIQVLIDKGIAYEQNGDVYFRSLQKQGYGKLSNQSLQELKAGARIEVNEQKEHPLDFALWKAAKSGEISWETPWGVPGRPGWHIECSVMARKYLGDTLDIHAGGADLCFPHHENEIAQSESLTGKPFANYWLHNGYINMGNEKMSKSLGNVKSVHDLRQEYDSKVIRYFLLSAHYRQPISYDRQVMEQAKASVERIQTAVRNVQHRGDRALSEEVEPDINHRLAGLSEQFEQAMSDDFNTANAVRVLFDAVRLANDWVARPVVSKESMKQILQWFTQYGERILGLVLVEETRSLDQEIEYLIAKREQARKEKNFALADQIRDKLQEQGVWLEDTPQGVRWKFQK